MIAFNLQYEALQKFNRNKSLNKIKLCTLLLSLTMVIGINGCCTQVANQDKQIERPINLTPEMAKDLLIQGNSNYLANNNDSELRLNLSTKGQHPYAVIITCSDSRAVPEIAFNDNFGDIFTIRTAGNVISNFETGSVEYGAEHLGSSLVVVMGHTN